MPHHKVTAKQWELFSNQISFSKETVQELSKLYIIIHEKVKSSIKSAVIDPNKNFSKQAQHHIQFIKNVLQKIKDTQNDQYLAQIQRDMLAKYQKNLIGLLNQIEIMLQVQESKINLNIDSLKGIQQQKRQKHDLKSEVVQSTKRIVRAKSGYKNRKDQPEAQTNSKTKRTNQQNSGINSFFPTTIDQLSKKKGSKLEIQNETDLTLAFQQKRQAVQNRIQNSMSKTSNGLGISFKKKYEQNYLDMYFTERKQFADLIFNQQVYDQIIQKNEQSSKQLLNSELNSQFAQISPSKTLKMQGVNSKLFPQFHIKTKFMKPAVKSKISNLITQIKKELINEYFTKNVQTLKAVNETQKVKLSQRKRVSIPFINQRSQSFGNIHRHNQQQTIKQKYSTESAYKKNSKNFARTDYVTNQQNSPSKLNKAHSYHQLNRKQIFGMRSRKSFINQNSKPFYQTQKWNQDIEKKYENKIMTKLIHAKI